MIARQARSGFGAVRQGFFGQVAAWQVGQRTAWMGPLGLGWARSGSAGKARWQRLGRPRSVPARSVMLRLGSFGASCCARAARASARHGSAGTSGLGMASLDSEAFGLAIHGTAGTLRKVMDGLGQRRHGRYGVALCGEQSYGFVWRGGARHGRFGSPGNASVRLAPVAHGAASQVGIGAASPAKASSAMHRLGVAGMARFARSWSSWAWQAIAGSQTRNDPWTLHVHGSSVTHNQQEAG